MKTVPFWKNFRYTNALSSYYDIKNKQEMMGKRRGDRCYYQTVDDGADQGQMDGKEEKNIIKGRTADDGRGKDRRL